MNSKVNAFNGFDPLTEVWLGGVYPTDFYYDFGSEVRDALTTITNMTVEDLACISQILESKNITRTGGMKDYFVDRPGINYLDWIV